MTDHEKHEIDRILSAIADGGADRVKLQALEALLLGRSDLQSYYAERQTMLAVLSLEHSRVGSRVLDFTNAISDHARPDADACGLSTPRQRSDRAPTGGARSFATGLFPQVCAAAVAAEANTLAHPHPDRLGKQ